MFTAFSPQAGPTKEAGAAEEQAAAEMAVQVGRRLFEAVNLGSSVQNTLGTREQLSPAFAVGQGLSGGGTSGAALE